MTYPQHPFGMTPAPPLCIYCGSGVYRTDHKSFCPGPPAFVVEQYRARAALKASPKTPTPEAEQL